MIVISCFDYTTEFVKPWAEAGYTCYCVDIQHPPGRTLDRGIWRIGCDVQEFELPKGEIAFAAFWPPCTDLAVSGARWYKGKGLRALQDAIGNFARCTEIAEGLKCPGFIENPVSTISTYWRLPDFTFDPWEYGDPYTKKTCIWSINNFMLPPKTPVFPSEGSKMHLIPPGENRANERSATPAGFSKAVFEMYGMRKAA